MTVRTARIALASALVVLLAVGITVVGVAIFVYGLKMTFPMFTWG